MIIKRKLFSNKKKDDETVTQKINRRRLSNLVGLGIVGTGSAIVKNRINNDLDKVDNLEVLHKSRVNKKYDKIRDDLDKKTKEILRKTKKSGARTGNRLIDETNKILFDDVYKDDDFSKVQRAKLKLGLETFKREAMEEADVHSAARRLKDRVLKKSGKKLALGLGTSLAVGLGTKALIDKKLKDRNKRINEERRNKKK